MASSFTFALSVDSGSGISQTAGGGTVKLASFLAGARPPADVVGNFRCAGHSSTTTRARTEAQLSTASAPYCICSPVGCTMATRNPRTSHGSFPPPGLIAASLSACRSVYHPANRRTGIPSPGSSSSTPRSKYSGLMDASPVRSVRSWSDTCRTGPFTSWIPPAETMYRGADGAHNAAASREARSTAERRTRSPWTLLRVQTASHAVGAGW